MTTITTKTTTESAWDKIREMPLAIGGGEPARLAELTEERRHREEQYSRLWRNEALALLEDGGDQEDDV